MKKLSITTFIIYLKATNPDRILELFTNSNHIESILDDIEEELKEAIREKKPLKELRIAYKELHAYNLTLKYN